MAQKKNIRSSRDARLAEFFVHTTLSRKLDIINAATSHRDLRSPPGNRYEELSGKLQEYSSIRVNKQYRLIFKWVNGKAEELFLDPHNY